MQMNKCDFVSIKLYLPKQYVYEFEQDLSTTNLKELCAVWLLNISKS
jgi:hypothetical protein